MAERSPSRTELVKTFCSIAAAQAHISYFFMSFHAVNPQILNQFLRYDPGTILFSNMLYGYSCYIFAKPAMKHLHTNYRVVFSLFGSFMFCTTNLLVYGKIYEWIGHRRVWASIAGYLAGLIMFDYFHLYLYFVDVSADPNMRRIESLDGIFHDE